MAYSSNYFDGYPSISALAAPTNVGCSTTARRTVTTLNSSDTAERNIADGNIVDENVPYGNTTNGDMVDVNTANGNMINEDVYQNHEFGNH
jgi:hypothetical protein